MASVEHSASFEVDRPIDEVFPLFSAEGETLWVPGWEYRAVSAGTELHEDYVFTTSSHDHAAGDAIWLVKRHEPDEHHVQLYKVEPGDKVGVVTVRCTERGDGGTRVEVSYRYEGLSAAGDRFIESFTRDAYERFIGEWQRLLAAYFDARG